MTEIAKGQAPRSFELRTDGLYFQESGGKAQWISSYLEVIAETRDEAGNNWGKLLRFKDKEGAFHEWTMPMSMLAGSGRAYREKLLSQGLEISTEREAKGRLAAYLQQASSQQKIRIVCRIGWQEDGFILPTRCFKTSAGANESLRFQGAVDGQNKIGTSGSFEAWKKEIALLCQGNSRLAFALSVAMAPPLLRAMNEEGGGFHFRGPSSIGKTTLLHVAGSVWGGGGIRGYLNTWRTTSSALELIAAQYCDALLVLDELNQVSPREAGEIAYMLANGYGKNRAYRSGSTSHAEWRLLFLSTGEVGLAEHVEATRHPLQRGQTLRMVDIPADSGIGFGVFENLHGYRSGDGLARRLVEASGLQYGTAIEEFLAHLVPNQKALLPQAQEIQRSFIARYLPEKVSGELYRVGNKFGLVAAAGEIATSLGILPWEKGEAVSAAATCFNAWYRSNSPVQESEALIFEVKQYLKEHGALDFPLLGEQSIQATSAAGYRRRTAQGEEWLFFPDHFRKRLASGRSPKSLSTALRNAGFLIPDHEGKSSSPISIPGIGKKRMYRIRGEILGCLPKKRVPSVPTSVSSEENHHSSWEHHGVTVVSQPVLKNGLENPSHTTGNAGVFPFQEATIEESCELFPTAHGNTEGCQSERSQERS